MSIMGGKLEAGVQAVRRQTGSAGFLYLGKERTNRGIQLLYSTTLWVTIEKMLQVIIRGGKNTMRNIKPWDSHPERI